MLRELVTLHARVLRRMPLVQLLVVVGLALALLPEVPRPLFLGWGALTLAVEILRAGSGAWVLRRIEVQEPSRTHLYFVALAALSGGAVGLGGALFLPHLSLERQALLAIVLFAMPAAGVSVSVGSRYILAAYAATILVPATEIYVHLHHALWVVQGLSLVFLAFLITVAADGEQLLLRSVAIRRERDQVVKELERSNAETRAAMIRAERGAQARARVLASASHDLRQPLHALSIYSAVLAAKPDPDTLREVGHNIDQIVRSLGSLLAGLLDLSRLSAGYYVPERQTFALDRVVLETCREYEAPATAKGLALTHDCATVWLCGDALAVGRILRNLLDNAVKYTERGDIRVSIHGDGSQAILTVADTGKGIPPRERARIFEEFYQLDNPGRDRSRGVGLGLAIVKRLCELLGADIGVESELERGARFTVRIPGVAAPPAPQAGDEPISPSASLDGLVAYVVDDEQDILTGMRALLEVWKAKVHVADSAPAAEQLFRKYGKPGLLIADLRLAGHEHGAALAARLRTAYGMFPVLIMTGETGTDAIRDAHVAGLPVVQKPVAPEALRAAIDAASL